MTMKINVSVLSYAYKKCYQSKLEAISGTRLCFRLIKVYGINIRPRSIKYPKQRMRILSVSVKETTVSISHSKEQEEKYLNAKFICKHWTNNASTQELSLHFCVASTQNSQ